MLLTQVKNQSLVDEVWAINGKVLNDLKAENEKLRSLVEQTELISRNEIQSVTQELNDQKVLNREVERLLKDERDKSTTLSHFYSDKFDQIRTLLD